MRVLGVSEALIEVATGFEGRLSSSPFSPPYSPVGSPICGNGTAHLSKAESSLCSGSQHLRILFQDGRLLDLMVGIEKGLSGRDLVLKAEDVDDFRVLEASSDLVGEMIFSESLPFKFAKFCNFLRMLVAGFKKEITSLFRKMGARKGRGVKILGGKEQNILIIPC